MARRASASAFRWWGRRLQPGLMLAVMRPPVSVTTVMPGLSLAISLLLPLGGSSRVRAGPLLAHLSVSTRCGASVVIAREVKFAPVNHRHSAAAALRVARLPCLENHCLIGPLIADFLKADLLQKLGLSGLTLSSQRNTPRLREDCLHTVPRHVFTYCGHQVLADLRSEVEAAPAPADEMRGIAEPLPPLAVLVLSGGQQRSDDSVNGRSHLQIDRVRWPHSPIGVVAAVFLGGVKHRPEQSVEFFPLLGGQARRVSHRTSRPPLDSQGVSAPLPHRRVGDRRSGTPSRSPSLRVGPGASY